MTESRYQNPYQPPRVQRQEADEEFHEGLVCRRGEFMVLRFGAAIPPRCFVTGRDTTVSMEVVQKVRPGWLYSLIPAGVLPYFILAPWFTQTVRLRVPISQRLYEQHLHRVNRGFALILIGVLAAIAGAVGSPMISASSMLLPIGLIICVVGLFLSSNQPVTLNIASLDGDVLVLGNIHPRCLAGLPEEIEPTSE